MHHNVFKATTPRGKSTAMTAAMLRCFLVARPIDVLLPDLSFMYSLPFMHSMPSTADHTSTMKQFFFSPTRANTKTYLALISQPRH